MNPDIKLTQENPTGIGTEQLFSLHQNSVPVNLPTSDSPYIKANMVLDQTLTTVNQTLENNSLIHSTSTNDIKSYSETFEEKLRKIRQKSQTTFPVNSEVQTIANMPAITFSPAPASQEISPLIINEEVNNTIIEFSLALPSTVLGNIKPPIPESSTVLETPFIEKTVLPIIPNLSNFIDNNATLQRKVLSQQVLPDKTKNIGQAQEIQPIQVPKLVTKVDVPESKNDIRQFLKKGKNGGIGGADKAQRELNNLDRV